MVELLQQSILLQDLVDRQEILDRVRMRAASIGETTISFSQRSAVTPSKSTGRSTETRVNSWTGLGNSPVYRLQLASHDR